MPLVIFICKQHFQVHPPEHRCLIRCACVCVRDSLSNCPFLYDVELFHNMAVGGLQEHNGCMWRMCLCCQMWSSLHFTSTESTSHM